MRGAQDVPPSQRRVVGQIVRRLPLNFQLLLHQPVEKREEDQLLGGEVKVEGGSRDAGASCKVVDRDLVERPFAQQPLGGEQDRALPFITGDAGSPPAANARLSALGLDCRAHTAKVIDTLSTMSTPCRVCLTR